MADEPADRFDVCAERSERGERCQMEAGHGGEHSFETRAAREERALETVREWLPELVTGGTIAIRAVDPDSPESPDGALFSVTRDTTFACRRGGGR